MQSSMLATVRAQIVRQTQLSPAYLLAAMRVVTRQYGPMHRSCAEASAMPGARRATDTLILYVYHIVLIARHKYRPV